MGDAVEHSSRASFASPPASASDLNVREGVSWANAARRLEEHIQTGRELRLRLISDDAAFESVKQAFWSWSEANARLLRDIFTNPRIADEYERTYGGFVFHASDLRASIDRKIGLLTSVRAGLGSDVTPSADGNPVPRNQLVFIVHGHDHEPREAVARLLRELELVPVILHEQATQGRTIVEKLEHYGDVAYAVVLLTPDDVGGPVNRGLEARARQNVILELGYFVGRLGRRNVCALHRGEIELPSDYHGIVYVPFDPEGGWRMRLATELRAAGFSIDMNRLL